jgi:hypothetical protein
MRHFYVTNATTEKNSQDGLFILRWHRACACSVMIRMAQMQEAFSLLPEQPAFALNATTGEDSFHRHIFISLLYQACARRATIRILMTTTSSLSLSVRHCVSTATKKAR